MTKIAFISDIHSNIDALQSVLAHIDKVGADVILCLGDIVGYGGAPKQCLDLIRERDIQTVMGNHDEYVTLIMDPRVERLRPEIRQAIEWTQAQLSMDDLKWLSNLDMRMAADEFEILHASYAPPRWAYCLDEPTFARNFEHQTKQLAFCGHSHSPLFGFQMENGDPLLDYIRNASRKTKIDGKFKTMVNVGSVGQPRDKDPRACVVFYEMEQKELWMDRVEYDIEAARAKIMDAKLPQKFADRLLVGA